jgi:hypothetical protein
MQILKIMVVFQCLPLQYVIYAMQIQIIPARLYIDSLNFFCYPRACAFTTPAF